MPDPSRGGPSDEDLVAAYLSGQTEAFGTLVERHERRVYNLALRMIGREEDARDAVQEAFLTAMRKLSTFRGEAAFTTWMHRVTVNACYDLLRKRRRAPLLEGHREDGPSEPEPASPDPSTSVDLSLDVRRALLEVPPDYRAAMILHDVQDLPYEEVATILGVPIGTVRSRIHRGRVALARAMGIDQGSGAPGGQPGLTVRERPDAPGPSQGTVPR
jgi:RNA polymerase sigma-70 factor (ECF subfamily)